MQRTLNLGILAHVDAGKTSLTEQLLYHAGVTRAIGRVDDGTTQTDTLELERQRGITIQSAIVGFDIGDLVVNLIDTPGHPDFIAEVERVIGVLDLVILVVSAVEGVQPQTRRLSRAIGNLGLPCLIFVNKIDRVGARVQPLVDDISRELQRDVLTHSTVTDVGTRAATSRHRDMASSDAMEDAVNVLSRHDEALLDRYVEMDGRLDQAAIDCALREQVAGAAVTPVLFGSAMTGTGVTELHDALAMFAPSAGDSEAEPLAAEVFKVQRLPSGERLVLCRIWSGQLENRQIVPIVRPLASGDDTIPPAKVTGLDLFRRGSVDRVQRARAGDIVRVHGLDDARIGDWLGETVRERVPAFEPPVMESLISAEDPGDRARLNAALADLADQDPLIGLRHDHVRGHTFVRLYGVVQQEVIESTLLHDYRIPVRFGRPAVICVERLLGEGRAAEIFPDTKPPFYATVGFRIAPKAGEQSTWRFTPGMARQGFFDAAEHGGRSVLEQGVYGWPVIDWDVEVTDLIYLVTSVPGDYRRLAMLVMADAIRDAGTVVCEPVHEVAITVPMESVGGLIHAMSARRGLVEDTSQRGDLAVVVGTLPAAEVDALTRELPGLSNGRGDIHTRFSDYVPVEGDPPERPRTDLNPFNRVEFLSRLSGRF